jgi:hypothetical protein
MLAQRVLADDRRAAAAAGAVPAELAALAPFAGATRVADGRFDPDAPSLTLPEEDPLAEAQLRAVAVARRVLQALHAGAASPLARAFRARYEVDESTPLGRAQTRLTVSFRPESVRYAVEAGTFTLEAQRGDAGATIVPAAQTPGVDMPQPARLDGLAFREPALLAAAIAEGAIAAAPRPPGCDAAGCDGLRAELADGSILWLDLDPGGGAPRGLRLWWAGKAERDPPDETLRYLDWRSEGPFKVASRIEIEDALGTVRSMRLVDWGWEPDGR